MIDATVRFVVLGLGDDRKSSATWEKHMRFQREPYEKEGIELWPGGSRLRVHQTWWDHGGSLVIELQTIILNGYGGDPSGPGVISWKWRDQPRGPPPETLQCWRWNRREK
jgi:hypothetical protein